MVHRGNRYAAVIAIPAVLACAPLVWSVTAFDPTRSTLNDPNYMWRPPRITSMRVLEMGTMSAVIILVSAVYVRSLVRRGVVEPLGYLPMLPLCVLAAYAGLTYRAGIEPVIGANIGAALMVMGAVPAVLTLIGLSIYLARRNGRIRRMPALPAFPWPPPSPAHRR